MKKRLLALVMAPVVAIGTGRPSGKTDASAATPTQTEAKTESKAEAGASKGTEGSMGPVTIRVANYALLEQGYEVFWNDVEIGLKVENPNITIERVTAPYGEIVNQVINVAGGGDRIDMVFGEIEWVLGPADVGLTVPVTDVLPADYLTGSYPATLDSFNVDGQLYGPPIYVSPCVLYYNTELFEQASPDLAAPPTAYDEMLEYVEKLPKLKDSNSSPVYAFGQTTVSVPVSGSSVNGIVFNFGGTLLASDGTLNVNNRGSKDAATMLKTLDKKGYNPRNVKSKDLRNLFVLGQPATYYDQSWDLSGAQSINPDAKNFTASAEPPSDGADKGQSILQAHYPMYVDNGDIQREACSKLTQYPVTSGVLNDYFANITPAYPVKKDMEGSENMNPVLAGTAGSTENVTAQVFVPQVNDLNLELYTLAQSVTVSGEGVDAAIANFKKVAEATLEQ